MLDHSPEFPSRPHYAAELVKPSWPSLVIVLLTIDADVHVRQVIEGDMMARQEKCMLRCSVLMVRQKMEDRSKVPESG